MENQTFKSILDFAKNEPFRKSEFMNLPFEEDRRFFRDLIIPMPHKRGADSLIKIDKYVFDKLLLLLDGRDIQVGLSRGTKIGTATAQKIGFHGVTPVIQASAIASPSADVASLKTAVDAIRVALTNKGITA